MKNVKLVFFAATIFIAYSLTAQTEAGKILVGGSSNLDLSFDKVKYKSDDGDSDGPKTTSFDFEPVGGYFIIDNLAVGLSLPISVSAEKDDGDKYNSSSFVFAPLARYYYDINGILAFGQLAFGFGSAKTKYTPDQGDSSTSKYGILGWGINVGVSHFLNDFVAIDASLGYDSRRYKPKENNDNNSRNVIGRFGISAGIIVCF